MLAVCAGLHDHGARASTWLVFTRVNVMESAPELFHERRYIFRRTRTPLDGIEVTDPAVQGPDVAGEVSSEHQIDQGLGCRGIHAHGPIRQARVRRGRIVAHLLRFWSGYAGNPRAAPSRESRDSLLREIRSNPSLGTRSRSLGSIDQRYISVSRSVNKIRRPVIPAFLAGLTVVLEGRRTSEGSSALPLMVFF